MEKHRMELAVESLETPALTKAQLAEMLFDQIGLNKRESKDMIDAFFDLVTAAISRSAPRHRARVAIRAPASPWPSRPAAWSLSTPAPSSRNRCRPP